MKDIISFEDFLKLDMRVGEVRVAERVEDSEKLVRLEVDLGSEIGTRQLVAGIGKAYTSEELVGRKIVVVVNLEHKKMMGLESQGMLLAASGDGGPVLLGVGEDIFLGAKVS